MAAMSNRTWVFEQPSPYTYPIFRPLPDGGLTRVDSIINSADEERSLAADPVRAAAWRAQLRREDVFYSPKTFGVAWLEASPFVRLVRRSRGTGHVDARKAAVIAPSGRHAFAYTTVLRRMVTEFAAQARAQDQHPGVFLIQTRDPMDVDLLEALGPTLVGQEIPYLATAEHVDPRDAAAFIPDGHYTPENDRRLRLSVPNLNPRFALRRNKPTPERNERTPCPVSVKNLSTSPAPPLKSTAVKSRSTARAAP